MARESGIEPLKKFAAKLKPYWRGIAARLRWPMHTGQLEGINNRIKVMKRMAYGYRDSDFFFLKIKAAFLGIRDEPFFCWSSWKARSTWAPACAGATVLRVAQGISAASMHHRPRTVAPGLGVPLGRSPIPLISETPA